MANISIRYIVYTHGGSGVRHHQFTTQNDIIPAATGNQPAGSTFPAFAFDKLPLNGSDLPFAFMSVHGASDGNHLYTAPGTQTVMVGDSDVSVLIVYAPVGGIGGDPNHPGEPGIWVDAFNVDTGTFSDSLAFIQVLMPPTPPDTVDVAKTNFGNSDGTILTTTAENVKASAQIDNGVPFVQWKRIVPSASIVGSTELQLTKNETGEIWFAFYQTQPQQPVQLGRLIQYLSSGIFLFVGDGTCGNGGIWFRPKHGVPGGGGPGPSPFKINVSKEIVAKMNAEQQKQFAALSAEYPAIAQSGLSSMTKVLTVLEDLNKLLTKVQK